MHRHRHLAPAFRPLSHPPGNRRTEGGTSGATQCCGGGSLGSAEGEATQSPPRTRCAMHAFGTLTYTNVVQCLGSLGQCILFNSSPLVPLSPSPPMPPLPPLPPSTLAPLAPLPPLAPLAPIPSCPSCPAPLLPLLPLLSPSPLLPRLSPLPSYSSLPPLPRLPPPPPLAPA